jgi:hypothetical protein
MSDASELNERIEQIERSPWFPLRNTLAREDEYARLTRARPYANTIELPKSWFIDSTPENIKKRRP